MSRPDADVRMLASALDLAPDLVSIRSREPLGAGSVTGLQVHGDAPGLYYLDTSALPVRAETGLVAEDDSRLTRIWQHPADPHLPALAPVAFENAAEILLARLGIRAQEAPELIAYRPGRRAVLRVATVDGAIWIKVVRPSRVERIVRAGVAAAAAGIPVPIMHGWSEDGLMVMSDATGRPATGADWDPSELLDHVDDLRSRFARIAWDHRSAGILGRLDWYASLADDRTEAVLSDAERLLSSWGGTTRAAVVHGDLHFGQLFLGDDGISGVIDVDTLAVGDAAEDAAAFLSHAIASALLTSGTARDRVWSLADLAAHRWEEEGPVRGLTLIHLAGHMITAAAQDDHARCAALGDAAHALATGRPPSSNAAKKPLMDSFESP